MYRILILISILLSASTSMAQLATRPKIFSKSLDGPLFKWPQFNLNFIYGENLPNDIKLIRLIGDTNYNGSNAMDIKDTYFRIIIYAPDSTCEELQKVKYAFDSLKLQTVCTNNPTTYMVPHYRENINPDLLSFYAKAYSDSIRNWLNSRNNKFARQIIGPAYKEYSESYYNPWIINIYNSSYLPDTVKFSNRDLLSTMGRRTVGSIDAMEQVKEGTYTIKSGLLQPGDSVYVSITIDSSPRYASVIKFIDLRNPDNNRHAVIESNDSVRVESWLSPKSRRLTTLAKKYGKIISKRLGTMKEKAKKNDTNRVQFKYWTDLMIIPAKR